MDPLGLKIGGAESFLKSWIRSAPASWVIELVGVDASGGTAPLGQWRDVDLGSRGIRFMPVCRVRDENARGWLPLSLRFTLALWRYRPDTTGRVLLFNRLEPALLYLRHPNPKVGIAHSDLKLQHTTGRSEVFWRFMPRLFEWLQTPILRNLSVAYTVSRGTLEHWSGAYPKLRERMRLISSCVDTDLFSPPSTPKHVLREALGRQRPDLRTQEPWILFVGRLQTAKAPQRVVEVALRYQKEHGRASFIVAGDGNLRVALQEMVQANGLEASVLLLGTASPEALRNLYRAADVLLVTSHYEGMPMNVLEALACGLPVVATDVGEIKSVVHNGRNGEIIASYDEQAMVDGIARVLKAPEVYNPAHCEAAAARFAPRRAFEAMYSEIDAMGDTPLAMARPGAPDRVREIQ